jgi:hypothetical protein
LKPRITGHATGLLRRQMMRVAAERGARSATFDDLRDFCSENPNFL